MALAVEGEPLRLMKATDVDLARRRMQTYHARPVVVAVERWAVGDLVADRVMDLALGVLKPATRGGSFLEVKPAVLAATLDAAARSIGSELDTYEQRMARLKSEASRELGRGL